MEKEAQIDPYNFFLKSIKNLKNKKKLNLKKDICGIIMESFQGWGSIFYPKEFVKSVSDFAKKK